MNSKVLFFLILVAGCLQGQEKANPKLIHSLQGYRSPMLGKRVKKVPKIFAEQESFGYLDYVELVNDILDLGMVDGQWDTDDLLVIDQALLNFKIKKLIKNFKHSGYQSLAVVEFLLASFGESDGYDYHTIIKLNLDSKISDVRDYLDLLANQTRDLVGLIDNELVDNELVDNEPVDNEPNSDLSLWQARFSSTGYDIEDILSWIDDLDSYKTPPIELLDYLMTVFAVGSAAEIAGMSLKAKEDSLWDSLKNLIYYKLKRQKLDNFQDYLNHGKSAQRLLVDAVLDVKKDWQNLFVIEYLIHKLSAGKISYEQLITISFDDKVGHLKKWILNYYYDWS